MINWLLTPPDVANHPLGFARNQIGHLALTVVLFLAAGVARRAGL